MTEQGIILDFGKHGYLLTGDDGRVQNYEKRVGDDTVLVSVINNMVTVQSVYKESIIMIACRYRVYNQEQLDFLLCNSSRL